MIDIPINIPINIPTYIYISLHMICIYIFPLYLYIYISSIYQSLGILRYIYIFITIPINIPIIPLYIYSHILYYDSNWLHIPINIFINVSSIIPGPGATYATLGDRVSNRQAACQPWRHRTRDGAGRVGGVQISMGFTWDLHGIYMG